MKKLRILFAGLVLALGSGFVIQPATASVDSPVTVESVSMPTHNETSLSLFSCAATRPSGYSSATVLHSHRFVASSTVDLFGQPEIDAFDCEVQNAGSPGAEATYRTDYIYSNVDNGVNGGSTDKGIVGPFNVQRF